jgi:hypothetical protein
MTTLRRISVLVLVAAIFSLGTPGCKSGDKSHKDDHPSKEQPKGDHPKH